VCEELPDHAGIGPRGDQARPAPTIGTPQDLSIGEVENRYGEQWIVTFDRTTREARLQGGDAGWDNAHPVRDGRVDGPILAPEEMAWLQACWTATRARPAPRQGGRVLCRTASGRPPDRRSRPAPSRRSVEGPVFHHKEDDVLDGRFSRLDGMRGRMPSAAAAPTLTIVFRTRRWLTRVGESSCPFNGALRVLLSACGARRAS